MIDSIQSSVARLACIAAVALAGLASAAFAQEETARFALEEEEDLVVSSDGTLTLAWEPAGPLASSSDVVYEVRRSLKTGNESIVVYRGRDRATFVSGLPGGQYVFKVRAGLEPGAFSEGAADRLDVVVAFHSRSKVIAMLIAGSITLAITVFSIANGHRKAVKAAA